MPANRTGFSGFRQACRAAILALSAMTILGMAIVYVAVNLAQV